MASSPGGPPLRKGLAELALPADANDVLDSVARRWVPQLLYLLSRGEARFTQLVVALPGISRRVLTERLRDLDAEGVIVRHVDPGPPTRISYALTDAGRQLLVDLARTTALMCEQV